MTRAGFFLAGLSLCVGLAALGAAPKPRPKKPRPLFGTRLVELPPGPAKAIADHVCLNCHSADMLRQQRLTEKQWGNELTKMAGWGSEVKESEKDELLRYLAKNFGPDNDRFEPVVSRPMGK